VGKKSVTEESVVGVFIFMVVIPAFVRKGSRRFPIGKKPVIDKVF